MRHDGLHPLSSGRDFIEFLVFSKIVMEYINPLGTFIPPQTVLSFRFSIFTAATALVDKPLNSRWCTEAYPFFSLRGLSSPPDDYIFCAKSRVVNCKYGNNPDLYLQFLQNRHQRASHWKHSSCAVPHPFMHDYVSKWCAKKSSTIEVCIEPSKCCQQFNGWLTLAWLPS